MSNARSPDYPDHPSRDSSGAKVTTPSEVRQGVKGHNVRYVLSIGTIGVIVAFTLIYLLFFA